MASDYITNDFSIEVTGEQNIILFIKPVSLKRAFGNVISNARKYATKLSIDFFREGDFVVIRFEDNGPGISINNAEEIFKPFKKQNEARTQNVDEGVGLGLSIARDAIASHGGSIIAQNSERLSGACFIIKLPILNN